jgi:phospholipase C
LSVCTRAAVAAIVVSLTVILSACGGGSISANTQPQQAQLAIAIAGTGTVISSPGGINCPTTCSATFPSGTSVTLTATPSSGFNFAGFSGACSGPSCQLVVQGQQSVSATFSQASAPQLTVSVSGSGTVTSQPAGINCPSTCSASFSAGTSVTLIASPGAGYAFSGFGGACSGMSCQFVIHGQQSVSATFSQASAPQLTVSVSGNGTVASQPAGINCPSTCSANFSAGTAVTLTAIPGAGYSFSGFGGACSGMSCQLVIQGQQSVSATFTPAAAQLTVSLSGSGTVTSQPAGMNCPSTCSASFSAGTTVTLTATPGAGYTFSGFGGACSGMSCQLTLASGQNAMVSAMFASSQNITAINHLIVMLQENRSMDHYFGHLPAYWQVHGFPQATNGTTFDAEPSTASNIDPAGNTVTAYNLQSGCSENASPSWNESHVDRNRLNPADPANAPMDGFVQTAGGDASAVGFYDVLGHRSIGYFVGDNQLNYYYFMASSFATSDSWFSPVLTRTDPNRMYLYAATSAGHAYPLQTGSPQLTNETIFQLLEQNGISWKIYVHPDTSGCTSPSCLAPYSYFSQFSYSQYVLNNQPNQFASTAQLMSDIQNGTLPQVAFIEPAGYVGLDEHPAVVDTTAADVQAGAAYVAGIINALMSSPSWKDSVFILSYDEGGGSYDHVPPHAATPPDAITPTDLRSGDVCSNNNTSAVCSFAVTGFRVPLIVISPFTRPNYVSHTVMDYTAILKLIETRFNLPSLTARDGAQPDMTEFFDFVNVPWATPPKPPVQVQNLPCVLGALNAVTIAPSPAPAGGHATVTLSLAKNALQTMTVSLSSNPAGVTPSSAIIANGTPSTSLMINVPTGITSLTITGAIGGIPVSGTVPVQ